MKNKLKFLAALALLSVGYANAQVGLGTITPNASSALDITSTTKGLLMPRLTTTQRDAIASPATGLMIFNTTDNALQFNSGTPGSPVWSAGPVGPAGATGAAGTNGTNGTPGPAGQGGVTTAGTNISITGSGTVGDAYVVNSTLAAANGLALNGATVSLGGALTAATTISGLTATNKLAITGTGVDAINFDSNTLSVDANNNRIGIGTATPGVTLDVVSATPIITVGTAARTEGEIQLGNSAHGLKRNYNGIANDVGLFTTDADLRFSATGPLATQVIIKNGGNVGIGTAAPSERLEVVGKAKISSLAGTGNRVVVTDANGVLTTTADVVGDGSISNNDLANGVGGIYRSSGSLSGNTIVNQGANTLGFTGNVAIGAAAPAASAVLDVVSANKGILLPRVGFNTAVANPVNGMIIYDRLNRCVRAYENDAWSDCLNGSGAPLVGNPSSGGNAVVDSYTNISYAGAMPHGSAVSGVTQTIRANVITAGRYYISTDVVNGVRYEAEGTFSGTGPQPVVLTATGIPVTWGSDYTYTTTTTPSLSFGRSTCGGFLSANVFRDFMCHNLGANEALNPNVYNIATRGDYYQHGELTPSATTAQAMAGPIAGWNTTPNTSPRWPSSSKGTNDPCPAGFKVPGSELSLVIRGAAAFNTLIVIPGGNSFMRDGRINMTLLEGGLLDGNPATYQGFGGVGLLFYWMSSDATSTSAPAMNTFVNGGTQQVNPNRAAGLSVRCMREY